MYRAPAPIVALLVNGVHRFCTCWTIERTDGVTLRFTDHDTPVVLDGQTHSPVGGPSSSAREKAEGLGRVQNVEVRGFISDPLITDEDLRAGRYRGAKVTEHLVDWRFPWAGKFQTLTYWVREATFDRETWTAQCEGLLGRMQSKVGPVLNRTCRHVLGDAGCTIDIDPLIIYGVVDSIATPKLKFSSSSLTGDADYLKDGFIVWTTGDNAGIKCEIKSDSGTGEIELHLETPFDIAVGDGFAAVPGCDGSLSTCIDKFANVNNFGGYPTMVGVDRQFQTSGAPVE